MNSVLFVGEWLWWCWCYFVLVWVGRSWSKNRLAAPSIKCQIRYDTHYFWDVKINSSTKNSAWMNWPRKPIDKGRNQYHKSPAKMSFLPWIKLGTLLLFKRLMHFTSLMQKNGNFARDKQGNYIVIQETCDTVFILWA